MASRFGLLPRVVAALAAVGVIPLAFAAIQLVSINRSGLTTQVLRTHSVAARTTAERLSAVLVGLRTPAEALANNPVLASAGDQVAMQSLLIGLLQARPDVLGVVLFNNEGAEVVRVQRRDAAAAVTASVAALPAAGPVVLDDAFGPRVSLSVPLADNRGRLDVVAAADEFFQLLQPEELGEQAQLVVVDRAGEAVIALADEDIRGFPAVMVETAIGGRVSGSGRYQGADGELLGAFAAVPGTPWSVLSRQPAAVAEEVAERMWRQAGMAVGVAMLIAAVVVVAAYRSLVRPLRELAGAQRRLAGLEDRPAKGAEIDILRDSFAVLERRINDQTDLGKVFLGRYQVVELLGEGAMGSVFRGWDPKLQRAVALKTIRLGAASQAFDKEGLATNLLREAVLVARFSHPNIVSVFDLEDTPEAAFVAMEFVEGTTLDGMLAGHKALSACASAVLGAAVAAALAAAHDAEVIHHDIKPGNILLGFDGAIKVSDFGIANYMSAMVGKGGQVVGTPGYMPPEALTGRGFDQSGDLFALGVVLFECLTGQRPFRGKSIAEIMRKTVRGEMTPFEETDATVPTELRNLIMDLLSADSASRPRDARLVAARLQGYVTANGCQWRAPERGAIRKVEVGDESRSLQIVPTTRMD